MDKERIDIRRSAQEKTVELSSGLMSEKITKTVQALMDELPTFLEKRSWRDVMLIAAVCKEWDRHRYDAEAEHLFWDNWHRVLLDQELSKEESPGLMHLAHAYLNLHAESLERQKRVAAGCLEMLKSERIGRGSLIWHKQQIVFSMHAVDSHFFEDKDFKDLAQTFANECIKMVKEGAHYMVEIPSHYTNTILNNAVALYILDKNQFEIRVRPLITSRIWEELLRGVEYEIDVRKHDPNSYRITQYLLMLKFLSEILNNSIAPDETAKALPTVRQY